LRRLIFGKKISVKITRILPTMFQCPQDTVTKAPVSEAGFTASADTARQKNFDKTQKTKSKKKPIQFSQISGHETMQTYSTKVLVSISGN